MASSMFRDAVKPGTFLAHYLDYMSPLETPLAYDFWCGMWLLSTALGRRVVINRPRAPVYLNLYVVLCADAGTTRKSSAIRSCEAVYRAAGLDNDVATFTGSITPEKLVEQLSLRSAETGYGVASLISSELVTLLGKEQYTVALPGLLTDLYDCPSLREYSRLSSANREVRNVFLTFIAASTPSWLIRAINPDVVEGGFTSRCLFVIEEKRKRLVAWPTDEQAVSLATVSGFLLHLRTQSARVHDKGITLTDKARQRFTSWYENRHEAATTDPFSSSFEAREDHHILRLAALLAANDESWVIDAFHVGHAIKIIAHHKKTAAHLFGAQRESAKLIAGLDKLRHVLIEAGEIGLSQAEITFKVRQIRARELEYALAIMHEMNMVQRFDIPTAGRKKTIWRATDKILARKMVELVRDKLVD